MSEWIWAVDLATNKLAFAFADLDSDHVDVETLITRTTETQGARLGMLDRQLRIYARQASRMWPPAAVWIEQPSGAYQKPQLMYVAGVAQAALFEALACPVWTITSGEWKKSTVGHGNATKEQVSAWVTDRRVAAVTSQDEADAVAIALAGRAMFTARLITARVG